MGDPEPSEEMTRRVTRTAPCVCTRPPLRAPEQQQVAQTGSPHVSGVPEVQGRATGYPPPRLP